MNPLLTTLSRLIFLAALVLISTTQPAINAQGLQQAATTCQPNFPRLGGITGTVRDGEGQPLQGVIVTAYSATTGAPFPSTVSDATGAYSKTHLPNGTYLLEFTPPPGSLQTVWYRNATTPLAATPVEVKNGAPTNGIDVTLPAGVQFSLTLRDPDENPVPQSQVTVFDHHGRAVAGGWSDEEGRVLTTPGLPLGLYRLFVWPPYGSPLLPYYHNQRPSLDTADVITATEAGVLTLSISMQHGAQLGGTVTDAVTGKPLAGVSIAIRSAGGAGTTAGAGTYTITDAQGNYHVAGLLSGTYRVEFKPDRSAPNALMPQHRLVTLGASEARSDVDVALARGGTISGRVSAPDGSPIAYARVSVSDGDSFESYSYSAADGTYAIYGLPSESYTLTIAHDNYLPYTRADLVTVTAPAGIDLATTELSPGGAISGKVTGPDGKPIAGVNVRILDAATGKTVITEAPTNADGVYTTRATLASGSYIVKFEPPSSTGSCHLAIEYSGNAANAATATQVQVSAPDVTKGIDAKLEYGGLISGQISDAVGGFPLGATVRVYDANGVQVTTGIASYLGHYRTAAGLLPGAYRVQFEAPGYIPMFYGGATAFEAAASVPAGASDVSIGLMRGGILQGRVTAADTGAPLENAAVTLYGLGDRVIDTQLTAFDGSYRFEHKLPSGLYRIGAAPGQRADGRPYFGGYAEVFSGGARRLAEAQPIRVVAPGSTEVNLAMPPVASPSTPPTPTPPATTHPVYLPLTVR